MSAYTYDGPVFDKDDREIAWVTVGTTADSPQKAFNNIRWRLSRNRFHQLIYIDGAYLSETENELIYMPKEQNAPRRNPDYDYEEADDERTWIKS